MSTSLALITQPVFGQCLEKYPEKYGFGGSYGNGLRSLKLTTDQKEYDCFYIKSKRHNIKCDENLFLDISGPQGNLVSSARLFYKGKEYGLKAKTLEKDDTVIPEGYPSGFPGRRKPRVWYETKENCLPSQMLRKDRVVYEIEGLPKEMTFEIITEVDINI